VTLGIFARMLVALAAMVCVFGFGSVQVGNPLPRWSQSPTTSHVSSTSAASTRTTRTQDKGADRSSSYSGLLNSTRVRPRQTVAVKTNSAQSVNYLGPTGGAYPTLKAGQKINMEVSVSRQRVYIKDGSRVIYTMTCSTGIESNPRTRTPRGTFYVQRERGLSFHGSLGGARYWVSWLGHGKYLFHSVIVDRHGNIIRSEALKLGHPASHGCIRLSLSDAKWLYEHIKAGTKVVIHD
jgi:lipoprotein-anchoring transpeptidase ErfK/SrfK